MSEKPMPIVKLDWSRLVGFDLADRKAEDHTVAARLNDPRLAKLSSKIGTKQARQTSIKPVSRRD